MEKMTNIAKAIVKALFFMGLITLVLTHMAGTKALSTEKVLFESKFADIESQWTSWDDPTAGKKPSQWRAGLTELSGTRNRKQKMATAILAGEKSWANYSVETSFFTVYGSGHLLGIVFGYRDPEHFYIAGYDFYQRAFEVVARTPEGFENLGWHKMDFPDHVEIPLRLEFASSRIRFHANDRLVFDIEDGRYSSGRFGLCASEMGNAGVHLGPVTVKSIDPDSLPSRKLQNLLSSMRGGKVAPEDFEPLIDHQDFITDKERNWWYRIYFNLNRNPLPLEAVFTFPLEKEVEIHNIGIQLSDSQFPEKIEFLISSESLEGEFRSLGSFEVEPEPNCFQDFQIEPVKAKYLKFRILSVPPGQESVVVHELLVHGFPSRSKTTSSAAVEAQGGEEGRLIFEDNFSSGSLDQWEVWDDPEASHTPSQWAVVLSEFSGIDHPLHHTATALLTGEKSWKNYSVRTNISASTGDGYLTGLIFGYEDENRYYMAGYNFNRSRFELGAQTSQGFELLAFARMDYPRKKWLPLQVDFAESRIVFHFNGRLIFDIQDGRRIQGKAGIGTAALGHGSVLFDKIIVTQIQPDTLPSRQLGDLLSSRRGAAVIYRAPPTEKYFEEMLDLLDHSLDDEYMGNIYYVDLRVAKLPEEAVFCFPQGRFVEIHRIGFKLDSQYFPKEIKFWTSTQTPKSGFIPLATITPKPERESYQEFEVPPTKAKYLKIQITQGVDERYIDIEEMFVKGYLQEVGLEQSGQEALGNVQIREEEPNNSISQAQPLPMSSYLGGKASKGDTDFYKLSLKDRPGDELTLFMNNIGILRPDYALQTDSGETLNPSQVVTVKNTMEISYNLMPDDYYLKITRPESYLMIVYDDSGSMGPSVPIVKRVLKGYLENLGEGLNIGLMKYTDETFKLSDFTDQPALLKEAIEKEVGGGGGTDTFLGLMEAINTVKDKKGNRAVLAIFDEIDGQKSDYLRQYIELWDSILDSGISFSSIGVRGGWHDQSRYFGNSLYQIFSEIAFSSGGQFYHSPSDEQVEQSANILFDQLTSPVEYRIRAEWEQAVKEPGSIQVLFDKGAERQAAKNVELVLDASNSMWGQIDSVAKIAIAKDVLERIINELPAEMNVGLRLYGHRYGLNDPKACQDTELKVPIGPIDKAGLIDNIKKIQPRGKTPLVYSVLQAGKDFQDIRGGSIILITDGIESCEGNINSIAPTLKKSGIDLKVHIVGFDIKEVEARTELEAIAKSTEGTYLDAKDSEELLSSLEQTLKIEFEILDEKGQVTDKGRVGGEAIKILEGSYILRLLVEPKPFDSPISVAPGQKNTLVLTKQLDEWVIKK